MGPAFRLQLRLISAGEAERDCADDAVARPLTVLWTTPFFGVIGIQPGPRGLRVHTGFHDFGSRGWDADCGDDCEDPPREGKAVRERLTLIRLFEELHGCGYDGGYDAVRRYARQWSKERGAIDGRGLCAADLRAG